MKILVIEDEDVSAKTLCFQLTGMGHIITHVVDGQSALKEIEANDFDCLICDLILPDISGITIAQLTLSFHEKQIPIIFISILENAELILVQHKIVYHAFLLKPISSAVLSDQIGKLVLSN